MKFTFALCTVTLLSAPALAGDFQLTSPDMAEGKTLGLKQVLNGFGCQGGNQSPALHWQGEPEGTNSFAITAYDPDAPTGSGWWHWIVVNLPATSHSLVAGGSNGQLPAGALQTRTDFGTPGFGGACPPPGDKPHRYIFTVHALKTDRLELDAQASGAMAGYFINANTLSKASLTASYGR
jgi:hypothetical protein